jgi:transposase
MSLKSPNSLEIPAETVCIVKAAFPKGNFCIRLRDEMGTVYQDEQFAALFSGEGQPALAPWRLVLVSILQFVEGLSDRQAAQMVRGRLDWKYLLGLELSDSGFDYSALSEFRARLLEHNPEQLRLDQLGMGEKFGEK